MTIYEKYILVPWPESQDYMEQPWFRREAILYQSTDEQEYRVVKYIIMDSAYFIPEHRIKNLKQQ
jgi:hypothetical protein